MLHSTSFYRVVVLGLSLASMMILPLSAKAQTAPASFTYQGKIYNANGTQPLQSGSVTFTLQLRSPDGQCLLFEETHVRNMTNTSGVFSLNVGEGTNTNKTALSLLQVIDNSAAKTGDAACAYQPVAGDTRRIRLIYNDGTGAVTFPTDQTIRSVPWAMNSSTLAGKTKDQFIQTSTNITQTHVENIFLNYQPILDLLSGTSTTYVKASDLPISGGVINVTSGGVIVNNTPTSNTYAVNQNYVDARVAGSTIDLTGLGNGKSLVWNSTTNNWVAGYATLPSLGNAGTYFKVTTDAQGRVISGSNLAATDIPAPMGDVTNTFAATVVSRIQGVSVSTTAPLDGQVLTYNATTQKWTATNPSAGTVTSVLATAPLAVSGTSTPTVSIQAGAGAGQELIWNGAVWSPSYPNAANLRGVANNPQFPTTCLSSQTLVYSSVTDRYSCTDVTLPASLTAGGDVSGAFSALSVNKLRGYAITTSAPSNGQILKYDSTTSTFLYAADQNSGGTVTSVTPGVGFTSATPITTSGTLNVDVGTTAGKIVQLDSNGKLPAVNASNLTNVSVNVTNVVGIGSSANLNVGTGPTNVVQLDANSKLPAVDGSNLTNMPFQHVAVLNSGTTWSPPNAGVRRVYVQVWGGGGAGATGVALGIGGSGGGGGGYVADFVDVTYGTPVGIALGAGGATSGANGGTTSFGTLSASGGIAGVASAQTPSLGGTVLNGSISMAGGSGSVGNSGVTILGITLLGMGGTGGAAGGGGGPGGGCSLGASAAAAGVAPGGGGGGGGSGLTGGTGGAGGNGRILVWY